jgi:hypothetical protein
MKWFRLKLWLARRSKKLDSKYTAEFWKWYRYNTNKRLENIELNTDNIRIIKK